MKGRMAVWAYLCQREGFPVMEPMQQQAQSRRTSFIAHGQITISVRPGSAITPDHLLAAIVRLDRNYPWWQDGSAVRLTVSDPERHLEDETAVVYVAHVSHNCSLTPTQVAAYTRHLVELAEGTPKCLPEPLIDDVLWTQAVLRLSGQSGLLWTKAPSTT